RQARQINDEKPGQVIAAVERTMAEWRRDNGSSQPTVAFLGLSYKANIDDVRASPAIAIVNAVAEQCPGAVLAVDPNLECVPEELDGRVQLVELAYALGRADILVLLVAHKE